VADRLIEHDRRGRPIGSRVWDVDLPCPECGNRSVIGFLYLDQHGHHQHTHYVCTFWKSPDDRSVYLTAGYDASKDRCGWHGWGVPEPLVCDHCGGTTFEPWHEDPRRPECATCHHVCSHPGSPMNTTDWSPNV